MAEAIVEIHFPVGTLPVKGFRCPVCHAERVPSEKLEAAQELAHELGLFGIENVQLRKLQRTGTSVAVTLDPQLILDVLKGAKVGQAVKVGKEGNKIVIVPA